MRSPLAAFCAALTLCLSASGFAQSFHNVPHIGANGSTTIGLEFMTSKTQYETESGSNFDLDRKIFGLDFDMDMGEETAVYAILGRIITTEYVDFRNFKGEGFVFGFGAKTVAYTGTKAKIIPYSQFNYTIEDMTYKASDTATTKIKAENNIYEFIVGSAFVLTSNPRFSPYAAFELFPLNKGEIKFKEDLTQIGTGTTAIAVQSRSVDYTRDDVINLKFGAVANFGSFLLRGEATMISEITFLFGAGFNF